ncbi:MAG: DUF2071 domain-containing protein [Cryomorphaceae bacterium]|nr:DUF2071 domain-containing protein [Cryomorphaceae bacterium]
MYKRLSNDTIQNTIDHRPWPLPNKPWLYYQEWNNPLFMHWRVQPEDLRPFIPKALELDTHNGEAWISLVPFTIAIKPRFLPALPAVSSFEEVNLRTYVKYKGKAGVYFLSIEGSKRISCWLARVLSGLPYKHARMQSQGTEFSSVNKRQKNSLKLSYKPGKPIRKPNTTDLWLSERYALFTVSNQRVNTFEIHHLPWTLQRVSISECAIDYSGYNHLLKGEPDLTHYSKGVQVLAY